MDTLFFYFSDVYVGRLEAGWCAPNLQASQNFRRLVKVSAYKAVRKLQISGNNTTSSIFFK